MLGVGDAGGGGGNGVFVRVTVGGGGMVRVAVGDSIVWIDGVSRTKGVVVETTVGTTGTLVTTARMVGRNVAVALG